MADSTHRTRGIADAPDHRLTNLPSKRSKRRQLTGWGISIGMMVAVAFAGIEVTRSLKAQRQNALKQSCQDAVNSSNWGALKQTSEQWTEWDPSAPDAWLFLAEAHRQQGHPQKAVECLLNVANDPDKQIPALLIAGSILFEELNRPLEGEQVMQRLLVLSPSLRTAHHRLIFFYAMTLQRVKMVKQIYAAVEAGAATSDSYVYLFLAGHLAVNNGYALNQTWLKGEPQEELFQVAAAVHFNELRDRAENAHEEPLQEKADRRRKLLELRTKYPKNTALLRYLIRRAIADGELDTVGRLLASVSPEDGNDSVFWHFRGWYFNRLNQLPKSEESYRKSIDLYRFDWNAWHGLAAVLRKAGKVDEAEDVQKTALMGKEFRKQILQLPTTSDMSLSVIDHARKYAFMCGDNIITDSLRLYRQLNPE